jgi:hypothetical protein
MILIIAAESVRWSYAGIDRKRTHRNQAIADDRK